MDDLLVDQVGYHLEGGLALELVIATESFLELLDHTMDQELADVGQLCVQT